MTNLSTTFSRADEDAQPATLEDLLRDVSLIGLTKRMGRDFRRLSLRIADTSEHLADMSGLVVDGEVYTASWRQEYAACGCKKGDHPFTRDNPWFARSHWQETRADAQAMATKVHGHLVTRLVAVTPMEVVG